MATEKRVPDVVEAVKVDAPATFDLTLNEYCLRLSSEKVGPEMIAGFQHDQLAKGAIKGSHTGFKAAFDKFVRQPA